MKINIFPIDYENQIKAEEKKRIASVQLQSSNRMQKLKEELSKHELMSVPGTIIKGLGYGGLLGLVVGVIIDLVIGGLTGEICIVASILGGGIVGYKLAYDENKTYYMLENGIHDLQIFSPKQIQEIQSETDRKIKMYYETFEEETKKMSTHFADSQLMNEVVNWMTEGFTQIIDAADRRSHVEQINIPFLFKVFTNKITCNLGVYDFELQRCRSLTSPIEQAALAKAIASALQLNIIMKYPEDKSGTKISIKIDYSFSSDSPATTITYMAPNGNYKSIRDW